MAYPRINTIQTGAVGTAVNTAALCKLPNASTGALPAGQTGGPINPIGSSSRWRIKAIIAGYNATGTGTLTITDGTFTYQVPITGTQPLPNLDLQCGPGAEVDITLSAVSGATGYINVSVESEG